MNKTHKLISNIWFKIRYPKNLYIEGRHEINIGTHFGFSGDGLQRIELGKDIVTNSNVRFDTVNGHIKVGQGCFFNHNCLIVCRSKITIGDRCSFGPNVCIYDHDHEINANGYKQTKYKCSETIIGDDCWIGANTVILRGSHIGEKSIIGAGSVIKGYIPPYSLVIENRSKIIKCLKG